ncbi:MAG: DegV family protein [Andreesenia angusta]|nr:DegV family protein [Andreesenia angusta]
MLKKTGIVLDSTSYLDKEYLEKNNIKIVPLSININDEIYEEEFIGEFDEVYEKIIEYNGMLKTSQPPYGKFLKVYEDLFSEGVDQILTICFSSGLSGTANSASIAANEFSEGKIKVIDTLAAGGVLKYIIEEIVEELKETDDLDSIEESIRTKVEKSSVDLIVMDLEYLKRGGRLTNSQAIIGNLLRVKPIISLIDGKLVLTEKARGEKRALQISVDKIESKGSPRRISVNYAYDDTGARKAIKELEKRFPGIEINLDELGPVIGGHIGPGAFGICTLYK